MYNCKQSPLLCPLVYCFTLVLSSLSSFYFFVITFCVLCLAAGIGEINFLYLAYIQYVRADLMTVYRIFVLNNFLVYQFHIFIFLCRPARETGYLPVFIELRAKYSHVTSYDESNSANRCFLPRKLAVNLYSCQAQLVAVNYLSSKKNTMNLSMICHVEDRQASSVSYLQAIVDVTCDARIHHHHHHEPGATRLLTWHYGRNFVPKKWGGGNFSQNTTFR